jgi:hypothetical protein
MGETRDAYKVKSEKVKGVVNEDGCKELKWP